MHFVRFRDQHEARDELKGIRRIIGLLIGTFCIERGWPLLRQDHGFDCMERVLGLPAPRAAD
ncbi:MAG: hypothetical protein K2X49_03115 [Acetobacteraceae bacterium]|nr:hypothetical protein [Acetobacteraceae bacterium]